MVCIPGMIPARPIWPLCLESKHMHGFVLPVQLYRHPWAIGKNLLFRLSAQQNFVGYRIDKGFPTRSDDIIAHPQSPMFDCHPLIPHEPG